MTTQSPFVQLRADLDAIERQIVIAHETPDGALNVLQLMDESEALLNQLQAQDVDVRAEEGRLDTLQERLIRDARKLARQIQRNQQTEKLSSSPSWQRINETLAEQQQQSRGRLIRAGIGVLALAIVVAIAWPWLFPNVPQVEYDQITQLVSSGNLSGALTLTEAEHQRVPDDPVAQIWIGILELKQGNQQAAEQAWAEARTQYDSEGAFLLDRGMALAQLGEVELAQQDAEKLTTIDGHKATGYLLLGQIAESQGKTADAISAYEQSSSLADSEDQAQVAVLARMRLGMLLQGGSFMTEATATP